MRKFLVIAALVTLPIVGLAPAASADIDPYGEHSSGGPNAACVYQRWYLGADQCGGTPWKISIAAECANTKVYYGSWWRTDKVCQSLVAKARFYTVKRGDTLWRIAIRTYGAGQQYRRVMVLNHLRSTRIHAGQVLRLR